MRSMAKPSKAALPEIRCSDWVTWGGGLVGAREGAGVVGGKEVVVVVEGVVVVGVGVVGVGVVGVGAAGDRG